MNFTQSTLQQSISAALNWNFRVNENFQSLSPAALFGVEPALTTGLILSFLGGIFNGVVVPNGTVTLTASTTNYVVANRTTGAVSTSTATTNWLATSSYLQLYQVVTGTATITSASDYRQAIGGTSSGSGMTNPMTTTGDIIYSSSGSTPARLGVGTNGQVLTLVSGLPAWTASTGGFSNPMTTSGDLILGGASGAAGRLGIGGNGQVLTVTGGVVGWAAASSGFANPMTTAGDLIIGGASGAAGRLAAGTAAYVLTSTGPGSAPSWQAAGGGGLTNWAEAVSVAAPNSGVPAISFTTSNAATNADAVLRPKGTGSVMVAVPDNTTTGGNKRGAQAVDLQLLRTLNTQVASGLNSTIGGGQNNKASADNTTVIGGKGNTASQAGATVAGGDTNTASGFYAFAAGQNNTASGDNSTCHGYNNSVTGQFAVSDGNSCTADAAYSYAGGFRSVTGGVIGVRAIASGHFNTPGDAQARGYVLRIETSTATPTAVTTNASATLASNNQISVAATTTVKFRADVVARGTSPHDSASWTVTGLAKNDAGTVSLVGTPSVVKDYNDTGAASWSLAVAADNTRKSVTFNVTGAAATTIDWVVSANTVEVQN